jgi:hypothetical protein
MQPAPADRAAVLVVRIWVESGAGGDGIRARLTGRLDLAEEAEETSAAASIEEIVDQTRTWLERFRQQALGTDEDPSDPTS